MVSSLTVLVTCRRRSVVVSLVGLLSALMKLEQDNGADGDYSFGLKFAQKAWEVFVAGVNNDDAASYECNQIWWYVQIW